MKNDIPEIKDMLKARIRDLVRELLPHGRHDGRFWTCSNPHVAGDDKKTPALKIAISGDVGAWRDWRNGDKGDVLDLVAFAHQCDRGEALKWSRHWLGIAQMSRADRLAMQERAKAKRVADERDHEKRRAAKLKAAYCLFASPDAGQHGTIKIHCSGTFPMGSGQPVEQLARRYWQARQCAAENVRHINAYTFRFAADTEWWKGAQWRKEAGRTSKVHVGQGFPAIHGAMRSAGGAITCCHVTFLDPIKPAKAPVAPAKLMYGEALGAVAEISTGPGGKPFWMEDRRADPVILCEGFETGLSIAQAIEEARIWMVGSLAGFRHAPVWLGCVSEIYVARDNNTGNTQARNQLETALDELAAWGKPVVDMASHVGDDFNDLMKGDE